MKILFTTLLIALTCAAVKGQNISLPRPDMEGGMPVNKALAMRHSTREFDASRNLDLQTVANLLWATCGINRPDKGLRTNPTARNFQEIDAYWIDANGAYLYDFKRNELVEVAKGDLRGLIAGGNGFRQDYVLDAPGVVLIVVDSAKLPQGPGSETMALIDAGIACENINLFCAGNGLATVPRMSMDVAGIKEALSLPDTSLPVMNNPVGYAK